MRQYYQPVVNTSEKLVSAEAKNRDSGIQILKLCPPKTTFDRKSIPEENGIQANWCKNVETYSIKKYIVDGSTINNLVAIYYRNKLVKIECDINDELTDVLIAKYGKPDSSSSYINGDVKTVAGTTSLWIAVIGAQGFLNVINAQDFAIKDSIDKADKVKGLKNL